MEKILEVFKKLKKHPEKIILVFFLVALGLAVLEARGGEGEQGEGRKSIMDDRGVNTLPPPAKYKPVPLGSERPQDDYKPILSLFNPDRKLPSATSELEDKNEPPPWDEMELSSIVDLTGKGENTAIMKMGGKTYFLEEGETFEKYELVKIDGVQKTVTVYRREFKDEKVLKLVSAMEKEE